MPKILRLLAEHEVPASFFMPAVSALLHPGEVEAYVAGGHEVGVHGWIHERNMLLAREDELDLTGRALETLEKLSGVRPVGIRTPSWDFSDHTLAIIEELGLAYDSSLMADDEPYELLADGRPTGIVEIPVEWIRDDAPVPDDGALRRAAALHAAARACSTSGATSSTPPTPRAGCSSSPCTRTSSGTAPASASCASCSRTSRATPTSGSPPMRRSPTWRAHSYRPRNTS